MDCEGVSAGQTLGLGSSGLGAGQLGAGSRRELGVKQTQQ